MIFILIISKTITNMPLFCFFFLIFGERFSLNLGGNRFGSALGRDAYGSVSWPETPLRLPSRRPSYGLTQHFGVYRPSIWSKQRTGPPLAYIPYARPTRSRPLVAPLCYFNGLVTVPNSHLSFRTLSAFPTFSIEEAPSIDIDRSQKSSIDIDRSLFSSLKSNKEPLYLFASEEEEEERRRAHSTMFVRKLVEKATKKVALINFLSLLPIPICFPSSFFLFTGFLVFGFQILSSLNSIQRGFWLLVE